jgi:hypothetical protein
MNTKGFNASDSGRQPYLCGICKAVEYRYPGRGQDIKRCSMTGCNGRLRRVVPSGDEKPRRR